MRAYMNFENASDHRARLSIGSKIYGTLGNTEYTVISKDENGYLLEWKYVSREINQEQ